MSFLNKLFAGTRIEALINKAGAKMSLRIKQVMAFTAVAIIPLVFATVITSRTTEQIATKSVFEKNLSVAVTLAGNVDQMFAEKIKTLKIVVASAEMQSMNPARQEPVLRNIVSQYPDLLMALVTTPNGDLLARSDGNRSRINYSDRDYFTAAVKTGATTISDVLVSKTTGKLGIAIVEPIKNNDQTIRGMLIVTVDLQKEIDRIAETKIGSTGYTYVVNGKGKLIMHPDRSMVASATDLSSLAPVKYAINGKKGWAEYEFRGQKKLAGYSFIPTTGWGLVVQLPLDEAMSPVAGVRRANVTILLIAAFLAVIIGVVLAGRFSRPFAEMAETAGRMAAGDLSSKIIVKGEREIIGLGNAINTMSSNLKEMLRKIRATSAGLNEAMNLVGGAARKMSYGAQSQQEATDQTATVVNEMVSSIKSVAVNAEEMSTAAAHAASSAYETAAATEEVARNAGVLAASVEETASSIGEMIASIKQVSENTDAVAASAEQTSSSITQMSSAVKEVEQRAVESAQLAEKVSGDASGRGMAAAAEAIKGMQNIKQTVEATAAVVNRLGARSQEIGQILKVIDEVTDQTSLLALNAAILAAQAGERGKGFAVVAEEIKDLAERTASSTQEIADLITSVQEETTQSVQAMGRGLKAVETGVSLVNVTNDVLRQVADSSRQSADMARAIERTTAEQAKGVAQITETATNIADQIDQIAHALQEQRSGSERIAQAAEQMREITRQVKNATQDQTVGSRQIAEAVESVTMQAAQVAHATSEQNMGMQQIIDAISSIQKITQDTVDVSIEMEMAVEGIKGKAAALQAELDGFKL